MRKILLIIAFLISGMGLNAQNLWDKTIIDYDGYSLEFMVRSIEPAECEVYYCSTQPTAETEITIPSTVMIEGVEFSVTTVGWGAFSGCSSLTSIEIPSTVTTIGSEAFYNCSKLSNVTFGENSQLATIEEMAFYYCSSLTNIEIPSTVTTIEWAAFYDCSSLTNIEIPSSVTTIEGSTFYNCSKLSNVTFGENSQLTSIGNYAFYECSALTSIEIPSSVTTIGSEAFSGTALANIEIPSSVTTIGSEAFSGCTALATVTFGDNSQLTTIEGFAFSSCSALTSIEIPSGVTTIGNYAFQYCYKLSTVTFGENSQLTSIGDKAFYYCSALKKIELPSSVTKIGKNAFYSLKSMKCFAENVPETDTLAFYTSSIIHIQVPETSVEQYKSTKPWSNHIITSIYPYYYEDYVIKEYEGYSLRYTIKPTMEECEVKCEVAPTTPTTISIPSSITIDDVEIQVTSIGEYAFSNCDSLLVGIEIPSSVTTIGKYAFYNCSALTDIELPSGMTTIGYSAFYNCSSLTNIEIPSSVTTIEESAFYNCSKLSNVTFGENSQLTSIGWNAFYECSALTSIEIPSSVTTIEGYAFYKCSKLSNVTFGENSQLTTIEEFAFSYCSLKSIEIPSEVAYIGKYAFYLTYLKVLICHAENVPETDENAFGSYANMTIYVPENSVEAYKSATPWNEHKILPIGGVGFVNYENYTLKFVVTDSETKECKVSCYIKPTVETELTIPSNVKIDNEEYSVTSVADSAFLECSRFVGDLVLPNSVTSVGIRAFRDCVGFNGSLILSENLKTVKDLAFAGGGDKIVNYTGILNIPSSLTSIGSYAFQNAIGLTGIVVEEGNTVYDSRENCNAIVETSTNTIIFGCQNSTIPDGITSIGKSAFLNCTGLETVEIPNSIVSIGSSAFNGSGLSGELVIPNSVTTIEEQAFRGCVGLTGDLIIPNSVTYLGGTAFWDCSGFNGKLTLSENIDTIFGYTFAAYDNEMHFTGDLIIPNNVKYIGDAAFQNCVDLKHVGFDNIEDSQLTFVGDWAFTLCSSLTSVDIPSGVKHIGKYGYNCEKLEEVRCYAENVPESEETIFEECPSSMKIYVPNSSVNKYKSKQPWKNFMILPLNDAVSEQSSSFNVYPNPVTDNLYIEIDNNVDEITIYNITGVVVYQQTMDYGRNSLTIDASGFNNGVYFVKIKSRDQEVIKKIIKK